MALEFEDIKVEDIDDSQNEPIKSHINTCIRIKPLGAGASDK